MGLVLCATDLGEQAAGALREAAAVARTRAARLGVLLVDPEAVTEVVRVEARARLERHVKEILGPPSSAELFVAHGVPHAVIIERAQAMRAELLVVGAHGASGAKSLWLGSVTDRVLREAHGPVMVARPRPQARGVLAATDFSVAARRAVAYAAEEAGRRGSTLILIQSLGLLTTLLAPGGVPIAPPPPGRPPAAPRHELEQAARERLEELLRDLNIAGEAVVVEGDPAAEIAQVAEQRGLELVVIGSIGRTGLARLLLGSVTEGVVHAAPCSVLVVR